MTYDFDPSQINELRKNIFKKRFIRFLVPFLFLCFLFVYYILYKEDYRHHLKNFWFWFAIFVILLMIIIFSRVYTIFTDKTFEGVLIKKKIKHFNQMPLVPGPTQYSSIKYGIKLILKIKSEKGKIYRRVVYYNSNAIDYYNIDDKLKVYKGISIPLNLDNHSDGVICVFCGAFNQGKNLSSCISCNNKIIIK